MIVFFGSLVLEMPSFNMVLPQFSKSLVSVERSRMALLVVNMVDESETCAIWKSAYASLTLTIITHCLCVPNPNKTNAPWWRGTLALSVLTVTHRRSPQLLFPSPERHSRIQRPILSPVLLHQPQHPRQITKTDLFARVEGGLPLQSSTHWSRVCTVNTHAPPTAVQV